MLTGSTPCRCRSGSQDIFRKYPNRYESIISALCENLETLDEPEAKVGQIFNVTLDLLPAGGYTSPRCARECFSGEPDIPGYLRCSQEVANSYFIHG